jgi:hypothetical protein
VLRPEEREDRELEVVRLALEQLQDARVLAVREAELAVEGLFRDRAQAVSLAVRMTRWKSVSRHPHGDACCRAARGS